MVAKNLLRAAVAGLAITVMTAGAAFAGDCGCGKCASGCDCGSACSLHKIAPRK
jgi:hypothetical protein